MKVNKSLGILAFAGLLAPGLALATNGYFAHGYGIKAKGMGGASLAMTHDTFGGANNPASMVWVGNRFDIGIDWFRPERSASRTGSSAVGLVPPPFAPFFAGSSLDFSEDSSSKNFFIPELGYNKMINPNLSLGVTIYGNGGMNTDFQDGSAIPAGNCPTPTGPSPTGNNPLCGQGKLGVNLEQLVIAPTVAFKFHPQHSVGVSPLIAYQRFAADGLQAFGGISQDPSKLTNTGHDKAAGWGVRVGWLGQILPNLSIGASYSSKIKMDEFDEYKGLFAESGGFDIPENYGIGLAFKAMPNLTLAVDYLRINYGGVKSIANSSTIGGCMPQAGPGGSGAGDGCLGGSNGIGFGWQDIDVWKLGVQWQLNNKWTLRAGYNHGDSPIASNDVTFNILAPGVVKDHYTLGFTYHINPQSELTVSYMHAAEESISGPTNTVYFPAGGTDTIKMFQNSLGVAYSMKF